MIDSLYIKSQIEEGITPIISLHEWFESFKNEYLTWLNNLTKEELRDVLLTGDPVISGSDNEDDDDDNKNNNLNDSLKSSLNDVDPWLKNKTE